MEPGVCGASLRRVPVALHVPLDLRESSLHVTIQNAGDLDLEIHKKQLFIIKHHKTHCRTSVSATQFKLLPTLALL